MLDFDVTTLRQGTRRCQQGACRRSGDRDKCSCLADSTSLAAGSAGQPDGELTRWADNLTCLDFGVGQKGRILAILRNVPAVRRPFTLVPPSADA